VRPVKAPISGFVAAIDSRAVGIAVVTLGGGRTKPEDAIDHAVGITALLPVGAETAKGEPLAFVHARDEAAADAAAASVLAAYSLGGAKPRTPRSVLRRVAPTV